MTFIIGVIVGIDLSLAAGWVLARRTLHHFPGAANMVNDLADTDPTTAVAS